MRPSATESTPSATPGIAPAPATLLHRCIELVRDDLGLAELRLAELLRSNIAIIPEIGGHLAFAGGKRFRPLLTLLCAKAAGFTDEARITVAAVGELLHTATLLHDDVVDGGEFRRGRPAARMAFGNGLAVLTGDFCLAKALQAVARLGSLRAVRSLADTVTRMAEGEVAQLEIAGDTTLDRPRYYEVIDRKTAALIAWCSAVAEMIDPDSVDALARFGLELGYAFQIADDVLDYRLGPMAAEEIGKDPTQDLREGKMTLPLILACEDDPELHARVCAALDAGPPMDEAVVREIARAVVQSEGLPRAKAIAQAHAEAAIAALRPLPPSEAKDALEAVTHYVVRRNR